MRVKIDEDILEMALFVKDYLIHPESKTKVLRKTIVWSGPFLKKVDLSGISFDNVNWNARAEYPITLSGTNAKIDFSKSFEILYHGIRITVAHCNLNGIDLSNSHASNW